MSREELELRLQRHFAGHFGRDCSIALESGSQDAVPDIGAEKRRAQFSLGRAAAARALEALGAPRGATPAVGPAGEPLWPRGYCGSISHSGAHALALVGRCPPFTAIGIDIERATKAKLAVLKRSLRSEEISSLPSEEESARLLALIFFSAKEACFKACFHASGQRLRYQDISLALAADSASLPQSGKIHARWRLTAGAAQEQLVVYAVEQDPDYGSIVCTAVLLVATAN